MRSAWILGDSGLDWKTRRAVVVKGVRQAGGRRQVLLEVLGQTSGRHYIKADLGSSTHPPCLQHHGRYGPHKPGFHAPGSVRVYRFGDKPPPSVMEDVSTLFSPGLPLRWFGVVPPATNHQPLNQLRSNAIEHNQQMHREWDHNRSTLAFDSPEYRLGHLFGR